MQQACAPPPHSQVRSITRSNREVTTVRRARRLAERSRQVRRLAERCRRALRAPTRQAYRCSRERVALSNLRAEIFCHPPRTRLLVDVCNFPAQCSGEAVSTVVLDGNWTALHIPRATWIRRKIWHMERTDIDIDMDMGMPPRTWTWKRRTRRGACMMQRSIRALGPSAVVLRSTSLRLPTAVQLYLPPARTDAQ